MSRNCHPATSNEITNALADIAPSQTLSTFYTNAFTCINTSKASSNSWLRRDIIPGREEPSVVQPAFHAPAVRINHRQSIMNHAKQLERSKHVLNVPSDSIHYRKRNASDAAVHDLEVSQMKRLKTVKPNIPDTSQLGNDIHSSEKTVKPPIGSRLSTKSMRKLDAFRFSETVPNVDEKKPAEELSRQHRLYHTTEATNPRYTVKDHSSRLILSGTEEMARLQQTEPVYMNERAKAGYKNTGEHSPHMPESTDETLSQLQSRYKIKDHASRLIEVGKKELVVPQKDASPVFSMDKDDFKVTQIPPVGIKNTMDNFNDLDDSIFGDFNTTDFDFEEDALTDTTGLTEMDDMDDSVFEQLIADNDAKFEAPSSAQPEINYFGGDTNGSPVKPELGLMLPPKLPSTVSTPTYIAIASTRAKAGSPDNIVSPFIRPPVAALVISPAPIPNLHTTGRVVTYFRLAEMFRELSNPSPSSAIELYATVKASTRDRNGTSQSFTFADLFFPQRPPYVHGVYGKCSESELFDDDSRPFLKAGQRGKEILARAIVRPKPRSGKPLFGNPKNGPHAGEEASTATAMEVEVLGIYVCLWEDIEYTKGIVMPEKEIPIKKETGQEEFYTQEKKRKFTPLKPLGEIATWKCISRDALVAHQYGREHAVSQ